MKKSINAAIILGLFAFGTHNLKAQESFGNAGLEIAIPVGDWAEDFVGVGIGGSGGYEFGISDNFAVNANLGVTFFTINSDVSDFISSVRFIPVQLGARYYFKESRNGLFAELQAGIHNFGVTTEDVTILGETIPGETESETYFSFAPNIGYFINENISISLRYQFVMQPDQDETDPFTGQTVTVDGQNLGYLGLKVAYNF